MQLKLVRHLWGVTTPFEQALPRFKTEGYEAIEAGLGDIERLLDVLRAQQLDYIPMAFTGGPDVAAHLTSFRKQAEQAVALKAKQLTVHSGSDSWPREAALAFYREVAAIEKDMPLIVGHETHRGRVFFNPWVTRDILLAVPEIKLACDFSHWVCVAERLNWDDAEGSIVALCAERTVHIHSRVGYDEGPQVPDPSAPEYAHAVEQHLKWWDVIWAAQRRRGVKVTTVTPEFGPPGYLHTLPHTNVPVADLATVCNWTANLVRKRFERGG